MGGGGWEADACCCSVLLDMCETGSGTLALLVCAHWWSPGSMCELLRLPGPRRGPEAAGSCWSQLQSATATFPFLYLQHVWESDEAQTEEDKDLTCCPLFSSFIERMSWTGLMVFVCVNGTGGFLCVCSRQWRIRQDLSRCSPKRV